ncbi:hypothetical protein D9613_010206 [Agrocybe pediades]|uniref:Uncharacterized protein n=1 Tax=Agrocybe pediades TaxID=84607 RepID=A0A8H4QGD0_9AGAR|nr:hypothetical protein D9613_010206 [Agrocybe pediades]
MEKFTKHRKRKKNTGEKDGDAEKRRLTSSTRWHYRMPTSPSLRFSYLAAVSPCPQQQQQHYSTSSKDSSSRLRRRSGGEDEQDSGEELEEGDNLMSGDGEWEVAAACSSASVVAIICYNAANGGEVVCKRCSRPRARIATCVSSWGFRSKSDGMSDDDDESGRCWWRAIVGPKSGVGRGRGRWLSLASQQALTSSYAITARTAATLGSQGKGCLKSGSGLAATADSAVSTAPRWQ